MSYSVPDIRSIAPTVFVIVGTGGYALPLSAPWFLLPLVVITVIALVGPHTSIVTRLTIAVIALAVIAGVLSAPLATSLAAAIMLLDRDSKLAAFVVALHFSIISTFGELLAAKFDAFGIEAAVPSVLSIALIAAIARKVIPMVLALLATIAVARWANWFLPNPTQQLVACFIPCAILLLWFGISKPKYSDGAFLPVSVLLAISWWMVPPGAAGDTYFLLPDAPSATEAGFFKHYDAALAFAGIKATAVSDPAGIPERALVILPWLTAPLKPDIDEQAARQLGELARERGWHVVLVGEHNNLGGVAQRIANITNEVRLENTLTVPPNNTDDSGPLHTAGYEAWPHEAILNRGAAVRVNSYWDKVLLAGDGWWAERDIGEWLWVGDYVWQPGDRAGRLVLGVTAYDNRARWTVVGDNSFVLNNQIYADPRPLIAFLRLATLWPAFVKDSVLALLLGLFLLRNWNAVRVYLVCGVVLSLVVSAAFSRPNPSKWDDLYIGQTGFDQRNFNNAIASEPGLLDGQRLLRFKRPIVGTLALPKEDTIVFAMIENAARVGDTEMRGCRRLGRVQTSAGPVLMDGQVCSVSGPATVLIGNAEAAAVISIEHANYRTTIVLDTAFLSQDAPESNRQWLAKVLADWKSARQR